MIDPYCRFRLYRFGIKTGLGNASMQAEQAYIVLFLDMNEMICSL